jgi:hypothetical protein
MALKTSQQLKIAQANVSNQTAVGRLRLAGTVIAKGGSALGGTVKSSAMNEMQPIAC